MADLSITQKQGSSLTYIVDCANRLAKAYPGQTITISSATAAVDSPADMLSSSGSGTSATFHLAVAAVTPPADINGTVTLTLSNGDIDLLSVGVGVRAN